MAVEEVSRTAEPFCEWRDLEAVLLRQYLTMRNSRKAITSRVADMRQTAVAMIAMLSPVDGTWVVIVEGLLVTAEKQKHQ